MRTRQRIIVFSPAGRSVPDLVGRWGEGRGLEVVVEEDPLRVEQMVLRTLPSLIVVDADGTGSEEPARFIARVELSVRLRGERDATRLGSLSRVHTVTTGEYMHQRAEARIRQGFEQLLAPLMPRKP